MSQLNMIEALDKFLNKTETQPQDPIEPTPYQKMVTEGRSIDAAVSQRELEYDYNSPVQDNFLIGGVLDNDPSDVSAVQGDFIPDEPGPLLISTKDKKDFKRVIFALDYTARATRSAMALTGISATAERFGDIRKSQGFWLAMIDIMHTASFLSGPNVPALADITEKQEETVGTAFKVLTDPETPTSELGGIGRVGTHLGTPEELEWVYDLVGELSIESKIAVPAKKLAKFGMSKFTKEAYEAGEQIAKKNGFAKLVGNIDNDQLSAIAQARKAKRVGLLGTMPPQDQIDDAVDRTFKYIADTKDARLTKQQAIKIKRKQAASRMYDVQGEGYGRGYTRRLGKARATTKTESSFVPFLDASPEAAVDQVILQKTIDNYDFGGSKIFTTVDAQDALDKLYETGELLTKGDVEHLRDIFGQDFANALNKFTIKPKGMTAKLATGLAKGMQGLNATARTLMTTGELSFLLRQGNYRAWSRPQDAIKSFAIAYRSLMSPKYAAYWDEAMRGSAAGKEALGNGLFLGKWNNAKLLEREEFFMAEWLDKVPVLGKLKTGFERGYTTGLNQLRLDWFDEGMDIIKRSGKGGDTALKAKWANYVNNMTGRADLDAMIKAGNGAEADRIMKTMVGTAKSVMFAPRFAVSKINKHKVAAELIFGKSAPIGLRSMMVTDTVVKWRRYERLVKYATENGYEVETDWRSSDFLKIKRGDTRFDVLGGDSQIMVMIGRLATGETKDTTTGEIKDSIAERVITQFLAGKLNPAISLAYDRWFAQQTFEGEDPKDPKVLFKSVRNKFIPLYLQDVTDKIYNGYEEEGLTVAESLEGSVSTVMMGFVGAGIQTYPPSPTKKIELIYNGIAQKMYAKDFPDLTLQRKQTVMFEAELDSDEEIANLKSEAGMNTLSPGGAARIQDLRNNSIRAIRKSLGSNYKTFTDSMVNPGSIPIDVRGVRLNTKQHKRLQSLYVEFIKEQLRIYPDLKEMKAADPDRRQWLEDIITLARQDAIDELFFEEPSRQRK